MHKHQHRSAQSLWNRTRECRNNAAHPSDGESIELERTSDDGTLDISDASAERTSILEDLVLHSGGSKASAPEILKKLKKGQEKLNDKSTERMGFLQDILAKAGIETLGDIDARVNQLGLGRREALYRETMAGLSQFDPSLAAQMPQGLNMGMQGANLNVQMPSAFNMQVYPMNGAPYAVNAMPGGGAYAAAMRYPEGSFAVARTNAGNYPVWPQAYPNVPSMPNTYEAQHRMDMFRKILQMIISLLLMLLQKKKEQPVYDIEDDEDEVKLEPEYDIEDYETKKEPEPVKEEPKKESAPTPTPERPKEPEKPKETPEAIIKEIIEKANAKLKTDVLPPKDDSEAKVEEIAGNTAEVKVTFRDGDSAPLQEIVKVKALKDEVNKAVIDIVEKAKELKLRKTLSPEFVAKIKTAGVDVLPTADKIWVMLNIGGAFGRRFEPGFTKTVDEMRVQIALEAEKLKFLMDVITEAKKQLPPKVSGITLLDRSDLGQKYSLTLDQDAVKDSINEIELKATNKDDGVKEILEKAKGLKRKHVLDEDLKANLKKSGASWEEMKPPSVDTIMIVTKRKSEPFKPDFSKSIEIMKVDILKKAAELDATEKAPMPRDLEMIRDALIVKANAELQKTVPETKIRANGKSLVDVVLAYGKEGEFPDLKLIVNIRDEEEFKKEIVKGAKERKLGIIRDPAYTDDFAKRTGGATIVVPKDSLDTVVITRGAEKIPVPVVHTKSVEDIRKDIDKEAKKLTPKEWTMDFLLEAVKSLDADDAFKKEIKGALSIIDDNVVVGFSARDLTGIVTSYGEKNNPGITFKTALPEKISIDVLKAKIMEDARRMPAENEKTVQKLVDKFNTDKPVKGATAELKAMAPLYGEVEYAVPGAKTQRVKVYAGEDDPGRIERAAKRRVEEVVRTEVFKNEVEKWEKEQGILFTWNRGVVTFKAGRVERSRTIDYKNDDADAIRAKVIKAAAELFNDRTWGPEKKEVEDIVASVNTVTAGKMKFTAKVTEDPKTKEVLVTFEAPGKAARPIRWNSEVLNPREFRYWLYEQGLNINSDAGEDVRPAEDVIKKSLKDAGLESEVEKIQRWFIRT